MIQLLKISIGIFTLRLAGQATKEYTNRWPGATFTFNLIGSPRAQGMNYFFGQR